MELYYMPGACSLATHIALEWIGKPYTTRKLSHNELKTNAYLKINPAGAVPSLVIDDWILTQNAAILNYLADSYPDARLGGDGTLKGRAEVNRWFGLLNSDMHPAFKPLFGATGYLGDDAAAVEKTKAHAKQTLRTLFERLNGQIESHDWLAGARSYADPYLFVMVRWAGAMNIDITDLGGLERFSQRMQEDPGVAKALKDEQLV